MPKGTATAQGSSGENISHFGAVRMRVVGTGQLKMRLESFDEIEGTDLVPFTLQERNSREPTRLCNFVQQRASLVIKTTEFDEYFKINRIIIFTKEIWTSWPSVHD